GCGGRDASRRRRRRNRPPPGRLLPRAARAGARVVPLAGARAAPRRQVRPGRL
ncbi:MAG: hypothetical protein AVDCRST_MAG69-2090, partial [uncultured Solirubrobacteraceae bacterium]